MKLNPPSLPRSLAPSQALASVPCPLSARPLAIILLTAAVAAVHHQTRPRGMRLAGRLGGEGGPRVSTQAPPWPADASLSARSPARAADGAADEDSRDAPPDSGELHGALPLLPTYLSRLIS